MQNSNLDETQPLQLRNDDDQPVQGFKKDDPLPVKNLTNPKRPHRNRLPRWIWIFPVLILAILAASGGALAGYNSGQSVVHSAQAQQADQALKDQYDLAVQDLQAGNYEVARQRLEYVINQNPSYPGAQDKLAQAISVLYATATPTPLPPTSTPTPTRDLRPVQDLFSQAVQQVAASDWDGALNTLTGLRGADPTYQTARVDALIYTALRNRGVDEILKKADLEGGSYDLALAERFGPLDVDADNVRNWARLYMYGNSFWGADPARAIYYFSQVASAAPYLTDGSDWTAMARYREVLIQYGDLLSKQEKWCDAEQQYQLAANIRPTDQLMSTLNMASEKCSPPTSTQSPTETPTSTPSATLEVLPTNTSTPEAPTQAVPTTQPAATIQPTATTQPAATTQPTATTQPVATSKPTATPKQKATTQPAPTTQPAATPTFTATSKPPTKTPPPATTEVPPTSEPPTATVEPPTATSTSAPASAATDTVAPPASTQAASTQSPGVSGPPQAMMSAGGWKQFLTLGWLRFGENL